MSTEPTPIMLAVPQSAVAAAGRALKFTIAELTNTVKRPDLLDIAKKLVEEEIMEMMGAEKAMFSALPVTHDADFFKQVLEDIRDMPEYDQDDCHRLRHKAKFALEKGCRQVFPSRPNT